MKRIFNFILCICLIFLVSCSSTKDSEKSSGKIKIVATIYPYASIAQEIAKDKADITVIVPSGTDPHDFEPTPSVIKSINDGDLILYNGLGIDDWFNDIEKDTLDKEKIINANEGISFIKVDPDQHSNEIYDPHVWLGLSEVLIIGENIKEKLIDIDEKNAQYYEENFKTFSERISETIKEYEEKFSNINEKYFITGHSAFAYLCREFNIEQKSVENVFGEGNYTANTIAEIIEFAKNKNIKTIFYEDFANPDVSETIAKENGLELLQIHTGESSVKNEDLISIIKINLELIYNSFN